MLRNTTGRPPAVARPTSLESVTMPLDPDDPDLHDALELACHDAIGGGTYGPLLAQRIERACMDVLRSKGAGNSRVECSSTREGTFVRIALPRPDKSVQQIVLRLF